MMILACPECGQDLVDDGYDFWCPGCKITVSFAQAIGPVDDDG